jgi:hypothetical protein
MLYSRAQDKPEPPKALVYAATFTIEDMIQSPGPSMFDIVARLDQVADGYPVPTGDELTQLGCAAIAGFLDLFLPRNRYVANANDDVA